MMKRTIAAFIGNILELYDFIIYGYFATTLAPLFFPSESEFASLLMTFAVFAVGFLARPVGAMIYGSIGDRKGRKIALSYSMLTIAVPTIAIGLLPTAATIGLLAPILLCVCRLLQGLSIGGEYTSAILYLTEHAPKERKGLAGSLVLLGGGLGWLMGSWIAGFASAHFPAEWAWRVPFLLGGVTGILGYWIRKSVEETPVFKQMAKVSRPVQKAIASKKKLILLMIGINGVSTLGGYLIYAYMPTYLKLYGGMGLPEALRINGWMLILFNFCALFAGWLSDKLGKTPVMAVGGLILTLLSPILFGQIAEGSGVLIPLAILTAGIAAYHAPLPALMAESFPPEIKASGVGLSYNIAVSLFSGTAPMIATWLIATFGTPIAPALYLSAMGIVSLTSLAFEKNSRKNYIDLPRRVS